jgi:predicted DNA-binding transcriptional regulator YafY
MSRSERLLDLLQTLRRHRQPVSGAVLAAEHGVSLRTLYRDIATLQGQGADIEGEPGLGYILKPGFMLPPLMFSDEELEALVLGSRWVAENADPRLSLAARDAMAKITGVLPADLRQAVEGSTLLIGPFPSPPPDVVDIAALRRAIRSERKLAIAYRNESGTATERVIWPFGLGYLEKVRMVMAWCELRGDFRNFRTDRIGRLTETDARYPRRRAALLKDWKQREGIAD